MVGGLDAQSGGLVRCVLTHKTATGECQVVFGGVNLSDAQFAALASAAAQILSSSCRATAVDFGDARPGELESDA